MGKKTKLVHVHDTTSLYSNVEMIDKFHHGIKFSSTGRERDVTMETRLKDERENMNTSGEPHAPFFYFHLSIIYELEVLIPFTYFKTKFLTTVNIYPSQVTPNIWGDMVGVIVDEKRECLVQMQAFNVVEFDVHFFSLSENFSSDYQLFSDMFPAQLSTLLETQLVRHLWKRGSDEATKGNIICFEGTYIKGGHSGPRSTRRSGMFEAIAQEGS
ncbi:hypothetical protein KIW84_073904 [Lathyrus oleraceus]|uniref:Uncharacterized protein n=1 Tax=Pisum sativum TaxID=3888 RepID=A0A9D4VPW4_PEA|nr:hypothetical protein KIW84_073904 [Pisum sativum]